MPFSGPSLPETMRLESPSLETMARSVGMLEVSVINNQISAAKSPILTELLLRLRSPAGASNNTPMKVRRLVWLLPASFLRSKLNPISLRCGNVIRACFNRHGIIPTTNTSLSPGE